MHDHGPFRAPRREPKPGTFHRPAHGFGTKPAPEAAELRLSGPTVGEQKLCEGARELPLCAARMKKKGRDQAGGSPARRLTLKCLPAALTSEFWEETP